MNTPTADATDSDILAWLQAEYDAPFVGWDFSYVNNRRVTIGGEHWRYEDIVASHLSGAIRLLDISTGGGELIASILNRTQFQGEVVATEGHAPNIDVAARTLRKYRARVVAQTDPVQLPLENNGFDVITNRHGAYSPDETFRVLAPDGIHITQQVGEDTNRELVDLLNCPRAMFDDPGSATAAQHAFEAAGFRALKTEEARFVTRYLDVGALVYYLKAIPWEAEGFSIDGCAASLLKLHRELSAGKRMLDLTFHLYLLVLQKPN